MDPAPIPLEIRQVWAANLEDEFKRIKEVALTHFYIGIDSEYPGIVFVDPNSPMNQIATNANSLKLIQLGISFMNESATGEPHVWQINFCDFDVNVDEHTEKSIEFFHKYNIDLERFREEGVQMTDFVALLRQSELLGDFRRRWISFQGEYDFAFLLRALNENPIPYIKEDFYALVHRFFPVVYDLKLISEVVLRCSWKKGLDKVAESYQIKREGPEHNAGSDSYMTVKVYLITRNKNCGRHWPEDYRGLLQGIENPRGKEHRHLFNRG